MVHVYEKLKGDKQCLELNKITQSLQSLITDVLDLTESGSRLDVLTLVQILGQCQPLVQQYRVMLEYYLLQYLAENRVTGNLLSVLLAVFNELISKGFCVPAEFEDEVAGEGATDFEDIEGGGLGQGEGVKDVSDQIENEDQLDEARKAGEDSKEDPAQQPDVRSEENAIEMSDDFEGRVHDLEAADQGKGRMERKRKRRSWINRWEKWTGMTQISWMNRCGAVMGNMERSRGIKRNSVLDHSRKKEVNWLPRTTIQTNQSQGISQRSRRQMKTRLRKIKKSRHPENRNKLMSRSMMMTELTLTMATRSQRKPLTTWTSPMI